MYQWGHGRKSFHKLLKKLTLSKIRLLLEKQKETIRGLVRFMNMEVFMKILSKRKIVIILFLFFLSFSVNGQVKKIEKALLLEDLRQLAQILESSHPDPYLNGGGKIAFHRRLQKLILSIPEEGLTQKEFYRALLPFVASVGDGHTGISLPSAEPSKPGIPLVFGIVEESLYVAKVYREEHKSLIGSKLLSVEGIPFLEIVRRQGEISGWDNEYQRLTKLSSNLESLNGLELLLPEWKERNSIKASFRLPSGKNLEVSFPLSEKLPAPFEPSSRISLPSVERVDFNYSFLDKDKKICLLRIDGMFSYRENFEFFKDMGVEWVNLYAKRVYEKYNSKKAPEKIEDVIEGIPSATEFFRDMVMEMKNAKSKALIIDVRKNSGGNSLMSYILAYFLYGKEKIKDIVKTSISIKKYSDLYFSIYKDDSLERINQGRPFPLSKDDYDFSEDPDFMGKETFIKEREKEMGKWIKRIPTFMKVFERGDFNGLYLPDKVFVVCSPWTYSSGYQLTSMFYKLGATIAGVPSGQAGNCFGDVRIFTLKNSGIRGTVSYKQFLDFPNEPSKGKILKPQIELTYSKLKKLGFDPNAEILVVLEKIRGI